jgi:hypothetical protein
MNESAAIDKLVTLIMNDPRAARAVAAVLISRLGSDAAVAFVKRACAPPSEPVDVSTLIA